MAFPSLISNGRLELVVLLLTHLGILDFALIVIIRDFPLGVLALILRAVLRTLLLTVLRGRRVVVGILAGLVFAVVTVVLILIVVHFVIAPFRFYFLQGALNYTGKFWLIKLIFGRFLYHRSWFPVSSRWRFFGSYFTAVP